MITIDITIKIYFQDINKTEIFLSLLSKGILKPPLRQLRCLNALWQTLKCHLGPCLDIIDFILQEDERSAWGIVLYNCCNDLAISYYAGQKPFNQNQCKIYIYPPQTSRVLVERRGKCKLYRAVFNDVTSE